MCVLQQFRIALGYNASMDQPTLLQRKLRAIRWLVRLTLAGAAAAELLGILLCLAVASFLLDRALRLSRGQRGFLLLICAGILLWQLVKRLLVPLLRELPEDDIAMELERRRPGSQGLLASAVQFAISPAGEQGGSAELKELVIARADRAAEGIVPARSINWRNLRRAALLAAICLSAGGVVAAARPRGGAPARRMGHPSGHGR